MHSVDYATAKCTIVCLSVCVTLCYCVEMSKLVLRNFNVTGI